MTSQYILNDGGVQIDRSKAVINGVTYPIRAISSFSITEDRFGQDKKTAVALAVISLFFFLAGWPALLVGVLLSPFAALLLFQAKNEFYLKIVTNAGEHRVLETKDREFIFQVREALNQAIASPQ